MNPKNIKNLMFLLLLPNLRIQPHRAKEVMASSGKCQELIKSFFILKNRQMGNSSNPAGPYKP